MIRISYIKENQTLIGVFNPYNNKEKIDNLVKKNINVLSLELLYALVAGMYHDAVMWVIFFSLYFIYANKPSLRLKLIGASSLILFILLIQAIKFAYREAAWQDASKKNLSTETSIASKKATSDV